MNKVEQILRSKKAEKKESEEKKFSSVWKLVENADRREIERIEEEFQKR